MALKNSLGFLVLSLACASTYAQLTSLLIPNGQPDTTYTASVVGSEGDVTSYQLFATILHGDVALIVSPTAVAEIVGGVETDCTLGDDSVCEEVVGPLRSVSSAILREVPALIVQESGSPDSSSTASPATSTDPLTTSTDPPTTSTDPTTSSTGTGPVSSTTSKSSVSTSQSQSSSASTPTKTSSGSERAVVKGASVLGSVLVGLGMVFGIAI